MFTQMAGKTSAKPRREDPRALTLDVIAITETKNSQFWRMINWNNVRKVCFGPADRI